MTTVKQNHIDKVPYSQLCILLSKISQSRGSKKLAYLRSFRNEFCTAREELFGLYRLLLPQYDKERAVYNLKEAALAGVLVQALGLQKGVSSDARKLESWRRPAGGANTGNFSAVVEEVCGRYLQSGEGEASSAAIILGEVNTALDQLGALETKDEKVGVMRTLLDRMNATQAMWLVRIILKDLKIGMSEKTMLLDFHPDAADLFDVCCDLRNVCDTLKDRTRRYPRQDIQVGKVVMPQLALRKNSVAEAVKAMGRSQQQQQHQSAVAAGDQGGLGGTSSSSSFSSSGFVVESKFDGERIQLHRNKGGAEAEGEDETVCYFTRRMNDFGPRGYSVLNTAVRELVIPEKCILDGELVVWNTSLKMFEPFGCLKAVISAAASPQTSAQQPLQLSSIEEREPPLVGDLELWYVAFDVLYLHDSSVVHMTLQERHALLEQAIRPHTSLSGSARGSGGGAEDEVSAASSTSSPSHLGPRVPLGPRGVVHARIVPLLPRPGNPYSLIADSQEQVHERLLEVVASHEEGVVLKRLGSKWTPNERSPAWVKLKPDYLPTEDIDCLVVGGYFGTGRNGGRVAQWLLALVDHHPGPQESEVGFHTFCRVGNGTSDFDTQMLADKLGPHLKPFSAQRGGAKGGGPKWLKTTGHPVERADVWIDHPSNSVVFQIKGDIRLIQSKAFATTHSLRFPRVTCIRWDKPWRDCFSLPELHQLVSSAAPSQPNSQQQPPMSGSGGGAFRFGTAETSLSQAPQTGAEPKQPTGKSAGRLNLHSLTPSYIPPDISQVDVTSELLGGLVCFCLNYARDPNSKDSKHEVWKFLVSHGAQVVSMLSSQVTHLLAEHHGAGIHYRMAAERGHSILRFSYLRECVEAGRVFSPAPKHRLHFGGSKEETGKCLGDSKRHTLDQSNSNSLDKYGDSWTADVDAEDVEALLAQANKDRDYAIPNKEIEAVMREVIDGDISCASDSGGVFCGCCVYLVALGQDADGARVRSRRPDLDAITRSAMDGVMRGLALRLRVGGARVITEYVDEMTHIVVYPFQDNTTDITSDSVYHAISLSTTSDIQHQVKMIQEAVADGNVKMVWAEWVEMCRSPGSNAQNVTRPPDNLTVPKGAMDAKFRSLSVSRHGTPNKSNLGLVTRLANETEQPDAPMHESLSTHCKTRECESGPSEFMNDPTPVEVPKPGSSRMTKHVIMEENTTRKQRRPEKRRRGSTRQGIVEHEDAFEKCTEEDLSSASVPTLTCSIKETKDPKEHLSTLPNCGGETTETLEEQSISGIESMLDSFLGKKYLLPSGSEQDKLASASRAIPFTSHEPRSSVDVLPVEFQKGASNTIGKPNKPKVKLSKLRLGLT